MIPLSLLKDNFQDSSNQNESGTESVFSGFGSYGSSTSYLNTPVGSELDSTEAGSDGDDDEFIAELTKQMADYMLEDDDDDEEDSEKSKLQGTNLSYNQKNGLKLKVSSKAEGNLAKVSNVVGFQTGQNYTTGQIPSIQCYQLENQPKVGINATPSWATKDKKVTEPARGRRHYDQYHVLGKRQGEIIGLGKTTANNPSQVVGGSGMRAVFLGGPGSRTASVGTGVFLPRGTNDALDHGRKKPGLSTVLIPTRVLQALEQHFSSKEIDPHSPSNAFAAHLHRTGEFGAKTEEKSQARTATDHQDTGLPQEWIY